MQWKQIAYKAKQTFKSPTGFTLSPVRRPFTGFKPYRKKENIETLIIKNRIIIKVTTSTTKYINSYKEYNLINIDIFHFFIYI